jgi:methylthioribose-1-phosphate isomerase
VNVHNPAFDVTPHQFITAIITDKGVARPPYVKSLKKLNRDITRLKPTRFPPVDRR